MSAIEPLFTLQESYGVHISAYVFLSFLQPGSLPPQCFDISCFIFFFSALIFHQYSVACHSALVKRATDPTGTRTQVFQLCPGSLSGRLCCLPVDSTLGWEQESL